jgi:hypothetical protein
MKINRISMDSIPNCSHYLTSHIDIRATYENLKGKFEGLRQAHVENRGRAALAFVENLHDRVESRLSGR